VKDFIFLGSKITAHGDCSHEIKRHLLLGRKVMTNLDSILKSRDITAEPPGKPSFWCGCELFTLVFFKSFTYSHTSLREELYTLHPPDFFLLFLVGGGVG